jgi:hypothetical protein
MFFCCFLFRWIKQQNKNAWIPAQGRDDRGRAGITVIQITVTATETIALSVAFAEGPETVLHLRPD